MIDSQSENKDWFGRIHIRPSLTSSTRGVAVLPARVCPQEERLGGFSALILGRGVWGDRVFIVKAVSLVLKQQHLQRDTLKWWRYWGQRRAHPTWSIKLRMLGSLTCSLQGAHAPLINSQNVTLLLQCCKCPTSEKVDVPHLPWAKGIAKKRRLEWGQRYWTICFQVDGLECVPSLTSSCNPHVRIKCSLSIPIK